MSYRDEPLVTIATFDSTFEAGLAKGALAAIGIPALVPAEALGSLSRNRGGIPEGALHVFASDRDRAVAESRRMNMAVVTRSSEMLE